MRVEQWYNLARTFKITNSGNLVALGVGRDWRICQLPGYQRGGVETGLARVALSIVSPAVSICTGCPVVMALWCQCLPIDSTALRLRLAASHVWRVLAFRAISTRRHPLGMLIPWNCPTATRVCFRSTACSVYVLWGQLTRYYSHSYLSSVPFALVLLKSNCGIFIHRASLKDNHRISWVVMRYSYKLGLGKG